MVEPLDIVNSSRNIVNLLHNRELHGIKQYSNQNCYHKPLSRRLSGSIRQSDLAAVGMWNSKRLQNMILSVGPGTPAAIVTSASNLRSSVSADDSSSESDNNDGDRSVSEVNIGGWGEDANGEEGTGFEGKEEEQDGGEEECLTNNENRFQSRRRSSSDSYNANNDEPHMDAIEALVHDFYSEREEDEESSSSSHNDLQTSSSSTRHWSTSMKHEGCINTATWLDCPWRLSLLQTDSNDEHLDGLIMSSSHSSNSSVPIMNNQQDYLETSLAHPIPSIECTTQMLTSGDDRIVKIWDVSPAMSISPPLFGRTTTCPFSSPPMEDVIPFDVVNEWKTKHDRGALVSGHIKHLASLNTGHRGNVFHAIPVPNRPGSFLTCSADGCLNLSNIETQAIGSASISPSVVVMDVAEEGSYRSSMCFSHHLLDDNTGLLCSEKGLHLFDLRLSPQSQSRRSLLPNLGEPCKTCAIYSTSGSDSTYVFAGGISGDVGLYDLRFATDDTSQVISTYRPSCFHESDNVSVSGIDLTKDKKEILVSYENDQVYTFPSFPTCYPSSPTVDELFNHEATCHSEFASYGGHLNRFTFLKCAKYAGPNDEYICTGSDSGHAFIYEKATGAVVSLLKADKSTCNGILPHPDLPLFLTYGIESTCKLWRATTPVSDNIDDSTLGRRKSNHERKYNKSSIVASWDECQLKLSNFMTIDDGETLLPDEVVIRDYKINGHSFAELPEFFFRCALFHQGSASSMSGRSGIYNDLQNLPSVILENYYDSFSADANEDEVPVKCGLDELKRRTSLIQLQYKAMQLGLTLDEPVSPWILRQSGSVFHQDSVTNINESDMITSPAKWLPFDPNMAKISIASGVNFNVKLYEEFFLDRYDIFSHLNGKITRKKSSENDDTRIETTITSTNTSASTSSSGTTYNNDILKHTETHCETSEPLNQIIQKITVLKEDGNKALKEGNCDLAARYYDMALQYCAVALMDYPGRSNFLTDLEKLVTMNSRWSTIKLCTSVRLNLSLTMLMNKLDDAIGSVDQANLALLELKPFNASKQKSESPEIFKQAKELQSKAYFRLGSAKLMLHKYTDALRGFERCLKCQKEVNPDHTDKVVLRRIAEIKNLVEKQKRRRRKKFKGAFEDGDSKKKKYFK